MVTVHHDWDEEDYARTLESAFSEYRKACYGNRQLHPLQEKEIRQAFFSGIHWLNCRDSHCPDDLQSALRVILKQPVPGEGE